MKQLPFSQKGFSLIEMMIAVTLSLIIIMSVTSAYVAGSEANKTMTQRTELQQDARFAFATISRDLRMAGSFGCALPNSTLTTLTFPDINNNSSATSPWQKFAMDTIGIQLVNSNTWTGAVADFTPQGQMLIIQYGADDIDAILATTGTTVNTITSVIPLGRTSITNAPVLAATNCQQLNLFPRIGNLSGNTYTVTPTGLTVPVSGTSTNSQWSLMRLVSVGYIVGEYKGKQGLYLFEMGNGGIIEGPKKIAANVQTMDIEFGIQNCVPGVSNDISTQFFTETSVPDWKKIGIIRLTLKMTRDALYTSSAGIETIGPKEFIYSTTVTLRRENLCMTQTVS